MQKQFVVVHVDARLVEELKTFIKTAKPEDFPSLRRADGKMSIASCVEAAINNLLDYTARK